VLEVVEGFLALAADQLIDPRRPGRELLVHPVRPAFAVDDTDAFADRVQDERRLLADQRPLQRQEVFGVGEDADEVLAAQGADRLVDRGGFGDVVGPTKHRYGRVVGGPAEEDEDLGLRVHRAEADTAKPGGNLLIRGRARALPLRRSYREKFQN